MDTIIKLIQQGDTPTLENAHRFLMRGDKALIARKIECSLPYLSVVFREGYSLANNTHLSIARCVMKLAHLNIQKAKEFTEFQPDIQKHDPALLNDILFRDTITA